MTKIENLYLQGLKLAVETLTMQVEQLRQEVLVSRRYDCLPEWLDLEQAVALKRGVYLGKRKDRRGMDPPAALGALLSGYRQKQFLQPCCGKNYRLVGGRKCWKRDDVIAWLSVTDQELLQYATELNVTLPTVYELRAYNPLMGIQMAGRLRGRPKKNPLERKDPPESVAVRLRGRPKKAVPAQAECAEEGAANEECSE